jgi:hypothetical protein
MKIWSIVLFVVCLNLACIAVTALATDPDGSGPEVAVLPFGSQQFKETYSIAMIETEFAVGGILGAAVGFGVGLIGFVLKQYTFGILAGPIWVLSILGGICTWILWSLKSLLDLFLAGSGVEWIRPIVYVGVVVMFFGLMLEQLGNKPLT